MPGVLRAAHWLRFGPRLVGLAALAVHRVGTRSSGTPIAPSRWLRLHRVLRVGDWSLAARMVVLSVGIAIVLSFGLTTIGYFQARQGLREQAEAGLTASAQRIAAAVDDWNAQRMGDTQ